MVRPNAHKTYATTKTPRHKETLRVPSCLSAFVVKVSHARKGLYYLAALLVVILVAGGVAFAQIGGPYNLEWNTVDGGGGTASGGSYTLSGTAGQADAGAVMSGGSYTLSGGFWSGAASPQSTIYTPLLLRNAAGS